MFDTTIVRGKEYVPYCKEVKEIRAPTDASVAILREMEQKTAAHIQHIAQIEANDFKFMFMQSVMSLECRSIVRWRIGYKINGVEKTVEAVVNLDCLSESIEKAVNLFTRSIASELYDTMIDGIRKGIVDQLDKCMSYKVVKDIKGGKK